MSKVFSRKSESESEEEGTNENETGEVEREKVPVNPDLDSEEDNLSVAEEGQEYSIRDEEESNHKAAIHADQSRVASRSEEETLSSSNGEYSSEEGSFGEGTKEFDDQKQVNDFKMEPPMKLRKTSKESRQARKFSAIKTEVKVAPENTEEPDEVDDNGSGRSSPTFEQMCDDLVLKESEILKC